MIITFGAGRTEETIVNALRHPRSTVGSDSIEWPVDRHPRSYGTHSRILGRYVRDTKVLGLEEAVRKMACLPAQILGIPDRGCIREGMWADVVVLDMTEINDKSTYAHPEAYATGVREVIINGELVLDNGQMTNILPGKALRSHASRDN